MTTLRCHLGKLEAVLTDPMGFVPHTHKWSEYWGRSVTSLVQRFLEEDSVGERCLEASSDKPNRYRRGAWTSDGEGDR
jgi:hypothetical protein